MAGVVGFDVDIPILLEPSDDLARGQVEVFLEHRLKIPFRPGGIGAAQAPARQPIFEVMSPIPRCLNSFAHYVETLDLKPFLLHSAGVWRYLARRFSSASPGTAKAYLGSPREMAGPKDQPFCFVVGRTTLTTLFPAAAGGFGVTLRIAEPAAMATATAGAAATVVVIVLRAGRA